MKVLYLTYSPTPYRVDFFNELGKLCDLTVLYEFNNPSNRDERWQDRKAQTYKEVFLKGVKIKENFQVCLSVIKYLKEKSYDVIVIGGYSTPTGMIAIKYLNFIGKKFILNCDGGLIKNDNKIKFKIKKHFISSATWWLSSGDVTNRYLINYGADVTNIYNYTFTSLRRKDISISTIDRDEKNRIKNKLGIKEEKVIISVGQYIYRKGYDILIEACKHIDPSIGVYVIGGKETKEYKLQKEQLNLDNIQFIEFKTKYELEEYYKLSDLFVLPTREDIWGLVINEAMSYGLPIITTEKCVAGLELIKNEINGYIVPVENHIEVSQKINIIMNNGTLRNEMGLNNINIIKNYTIENMAQGHKKIFKKILCDKN